MTYLRSPSSHNIEVDFRSLRRYSADSRAGGEPGPDGSAVMAAPDRADGEDSASGRHPTEIPGARPEYDRASPLRLREVFIEPYARPLLSVFNRHAESVIERHGLTEAHLRAVAVRLSPPVKSETGIVVECSDGRRIAADEAILAIGRGGVVNVPSWAAALHGRERSVFHAFDDRFSLDDIVSTLTARSSVAIVGSGATGVQIATALARRSPAAVTLISRSELRVRMFDSNPCFIGPKCLAAFREEPDYDIRRAMIRAARYPGSVPPNVMEELQRAEADNRLRIAIGETQSLAKVTGGFRLSGERFRCTEGARVAERETRSINADIVILATGFSHSRPGGELVDAAIEEFRMPVAPCGYPIPDSELRWGAAIRVAGPLAELELGPSAPNIIGAHGAAKRICAYRLSRDNAA